jgi:hypothetical protein
MKEDMFSSERETLLTLHNWIELSAGKTTEHQERPHMRVWLIHHARP